MIEFKHGERPPFCRQGRIPLRDVSASARFSRQLMIEHASGSGIDELSERYWIHRQVVVKRINRMRALSDMDLISTGTYTGVSIIAMEMLDEYLGGSSYRNVARRYEMSVTGARKRIMKAWDQREKEKLSAKQTQPANA